MAARFAIHPGTVTSKNDGDRHYVTAHRLASLYQLKTGEWIVWHEKVSEKFYNWNDYIHLYPSYEGNYGRPDE